MHCKLNRPSLLNLILVSFLLGTHRLTLFIGKKGGIRASLMQALRGKKRASAPPQAINQIAFERM